MADTGRLTLDPVVRAEIAALLAGMNNASMMLFAAIVDVASGDSESATQNLQDFMAKNSEIMADLHAFMHDA